jgi:Carboxypeptidase regulatory-like domain
MRGRNKTRALINALTVTAVLFVCSLASMAQGITTGSIAGTATDQTGGIVPGVKVKLRDEGTNAIKEVVANDSGGFVLPNLPFGTYEVTVSAAGFQTAVYKGVVVESSRTTDLNVIMQVGNVVETVQIEGAAPVLEVTSNTISNTVRNEAVRNLPLGGRNILNFALLVPGSASVGGSGRNSAYNGMPGATINMMLDGINNNSNGFKSGGTSFFGTVPTRVDAIEEVTIATTGLGADASGEGAMQVQFVTKRGTSEYHGGVFMQHRNSALNANSLANKSVGLDRAPSHMNEFGGRLGGPLPIPFGRLKEKLFFFVNYEREVTPGSSTPTRVVLRPEAQQGVFRYRDAEGVERAPNLLEIAGRSGFPSQIDPIIADQFRQISSFLNGGALSDRDRITQNFDFITPTKTVSTFPTARIDYQITPNLTWTGTWNLFDRGISGSKRWPNDPRPASDLYSNTWYIASTSVNWTVTPRITNEIKYGVQHNTDLNSKDQSFDKLDINGRMMTLANLPFGLSTLVDPALTIPRTNGTHNLYDNMKLLFGNHNMTIGGTFRHIGWYDANYNGGGIPAVTMGVATGDPITTALTLSEDLPRISTQDLNNARSLYALLTGRVSAISATRGIDRETKQFKDQTHIIRLDKQNVGSLYFQDSWRFRTNLTLNYGLRWEFSGDTHDGSDIYTSPTLEHLLGPSGSLFTPGILNGIQDPQIFQQSHTYRRDYLNPGPNFGFAWSPNFKDGALAKLFGKDQKTVIRGSYGVSYYDEGTNNFTSFASNSPGLLQTLSLSPGMPGFAVGDLSLSEPFPSLVGFPANYSPPFRQADFTFRSINFSSMQPDLRTPYIQQWNLGIQRELAKNTVVEVRYVGNKGTHLWRGYNLNEVNIFENGFLDEFKNAQRNLQINQKAGVNSFAFRAGVDGLVPLPIFEAAFGARGSQGALPSNQGFTNGGFINLLDQGQAGRFASQLAGNSTYLCRMLGSSFEPCARLGFNASGPYPINFFQANPYAAGQNLRLMTDDSNSSYHGMQMQFRQRLTKGLSLTANYTWSKAINDRFVDSDNNFVNYTTLRDKKLDRRPSIFDLRHAFQAYWGYELPFGRGKSLATGNSVLDNVIGGWTFSGIVRWQSGRVFRLTSDRQTVNQNESGVILNGITRDELQKMVKISSGGPLGNVLYLDPKLIGQDGRANPQYLAYPTKPGEFGQFIELYGPSVFIPDFSLAKDIPIKERVKFNFWVTFLNAFNSPVFDVPTNGVAGTISIDSTTFGQTRSIFGGGNARAIQFRAGIVF